MADTNAPMTDKEHKQVEDHILGKNMSEIGSYFCGLLAEGFPDWEAKTEFWSMANSYGYQNNEPKQLLAFAVESRHVWQTKIDFVNRHMGELFVQGAAKHEEIRVRFLDSKIIPFLAELLSRGK